MACSALAPGQVLASKGREIEREVMERKELKSRGNQESVDANEQEKLGIGLEEKTKTKTVTHQGKGRLCEALL